MSLTVLHTRSAMLNQWGTLLQRTSFINSFKCGVQVADLRLALQRAEQQQARKEDYLREEISDLQQVT